ncbi:hypothetical protein GCM10010151_68900 [Actinoallomurus spadix]|uniref:Uncharacterized protein n=1 Tax=Actinoallomurus spadix TaxID=79912 RepID=A0ABN0XP25_9ACTN
MSSNDIALRGPARHGPGPAATVPPETRPAPASDRTRLFARVVARGRDRGKVLGILSAISGDCASSGAWFQPITEPLGRYGVSVY